MGRCLKYAMLWMVLVLVGCGGGGGGGGSPNNTTLPGQTVAVTYTLHVALQGDNGAGITTIAQGESATAYANVIENKTIATPGMADRITHQPAVGIRVKFESGGGTFAPADGTALTDQYGDARVAFTATGTTGAYTLTAAAEGATGKVNYAIGTATDTELSVAVLDMTGRSVTRLEGGERYRAVAQAVRITRDASGWPTGRTIPVSDLIVTFASDGGLFDPADGTALTDADGQAEVVFVTNVARGASVLTATATATETELTATLSYELTLPMIRFGSGEPFEDGRLTVGLPQISAGGTTAINAVLVREDGAPFLAPVPVTFTSGCAAAGRAELVPSALAANGVVTVNYTAKAGCVGADTVQAAVEIPGYALPLTAIGEVVVAAPVAGMIEFVSADPGAIAIKGNGTLEMPERTEVKFRVTSSADIPVPGRTVRFSLTTTAGGLALQAQSAVTDAEGLVAVRVHSGTVATTFRVIATLDDAALATQSQGIVVATGPATPAGFSLSASNYTPEAWSYDGETVTVTARGGDAQGNPVADGTIVQFTTTGGVIDASCAMVNGECTVLWRSQAPRPGNGRVTVKATTLGHGNGANLTATLVLVMATSEASIQIAPDPVRIEFDGAQTVQIKVSDLNGNLPPAGATITASTTKGVLSETSWVVGTSNAPGPFVAITTFSGNGSDVGQGRLSVKVKSPKGKETSHQAVVEIAEAPPAEPDALAFVAAQPTQIATRGHGAPGQPETTDVSFRLTAQGQPVAGRTVQFALSTTAGGLALSQASATTDATGTVIVTVKAGTTATAFRVTASVADTALTAQSTELWVVAPAEPDALAFVAAQPTQIATRGHGAPGQPETADVSFRLTAQGQPVAGRTVQFALSTTAGGLALSQASATTDGAGMAYVTVNAGTAATAFRVTATLSSPLLSSQTPELWVVEP